MLANRVAHIGHDVYIGAGADGVWTLFDKSVSSASRPLHSVDMSGASLHPSPEQDFIAIMAPYPSTKHHVYLPESEHTLFLRTGAPVLSIVWHPSISSLLLILTEANTVEVHDVLGANVTDVVPQVKSISLVDLRNEYSGMHSKNHQQGGNHHHQDPGSPSLKRETTTATVATTASTVAAEGSHHHHYPHHFSHFIHMAVVEGVTGSEPLLLLLANDVQGHVFTVQLQNDGGFPITGPKAPVPVFHCDTKKFPKSTLKNVVSPLSVQASMVDVTCGLFGIAVLRSDGCVCTGYLKEKWMYHGGSHHPLNQQVFQLFPPLDLTPSLQQEEENEEPSSTLTAAPGTTSGLVSTAPGGSKPSSAKLKAAASPKTSSGMPSRGKSTNTWSTMSTSSHIPDLTRDFMMHHHSSVLENMFLFGVRPERVEVTPGSPDALGLEPEDAEISRSFALVVFPFWDEVNEGWILDPTAATRMREGTTTTTSGGDTDPGMAFRLPILSRNNKEPPAPLAVTLPFDLDGHNVALGSYTLCLEPVREAPVVVAPGSSKLAIEDNKTAKKKADSVSSKNSTSSTKKKSEGEEGSSLPEISPLFVDLNGFLMNCIMATTPWSESETLLAAPFNQSEVKSTGGLVLGGISEFIGNIISRRFTNTELDGQLSQLARDTNMMKDKLKKWDEDLSKQQKALTDQCASLKQKFKTLEELMDSNNEKASWTFVAQRGLPSLENLNVRFGEVHECLGDLERRVEEKEDEVEKAKNEELKKQMRRATRSKTPRSAKMTPSMTPRDNKSAENSLVK